MSHRTAQLLLLGVLLAFVSPVVVGGRVLLGHDLGRELGALDRPGERRLEQRLSDDQTSTYLPELQVHLTGARTGWLATWNPHVELGRPTGHLSGFSPVFLPTRLVALATDDALVAYSWLVVLALAGCGAFGYGFLRALELAPAACLAGALGFAANPWIAHRVNAAMFPWGVCWTLAILWGVVRVVERATWPRVVALAFAVHALLLTGYPQQIVWHAYFVVGFALVRVFRRPDRRARAFGALALAALVGLATALPVLADLALATERSGRTDVDPAFFTAGMRTLSDLRDTGLLVLDHFDPFWFGDPSERAFPLAFHGVSTGALGTLAALTLAGGLWRRLWGWQLLVALALLVSVSRPLYELGIRFAGLGLSRFGPPSGVVIPAVVLAAFGADGALRGALPRRWLASALVVLPLALAAAATLAVEPSPALAPTALGVALVLGVVLLVWTRSPWLLAALAVVATFHYGFRLLPLRERAETPLTSPLVEAVRERTPGGRRFAWVGRGARGTLPANVEGLVGLASVHAYDPLAWEGYRAWVLGLSASGMAVTPPGGGEQTVAESADTYGRHFRRIVADTLPAEELARAGVSVLLSTARLDERVATLAGTASGVGVYETTRPAALAWHVPGFEPALEQVASGEVRLARPLPEGTTALELHRDLGDLVEVGVPKGEAPALLVLGRQYHPQWRASNTSGLWLRTVAVDGFYQGVVIPPGNANVQLSFLPSARWMWATQLAFVVAGAAGAFHLLRRRPAA